MSAGALRLVVLCVLVSAALAPLAALRAQQGGAPAPAPSPPPQAEPQPGGDEAGDAAEPDGDEAADDEAAEDDEAADDAVIDEDADLASGHFPVPAGMHLSTYASRLCARVDQSGAIDSGAGVLQLVDAESGQPLVVHDLAFGRGPALWAGGTLDLPGVEAQVKLIAVPVEAHGDHRVRAIVHVELANHGQDLVVVKLGARLSAGGGDPLRRPVDALDFAPGAVFAHEDGVITRDGDAIVAWEGPDPQVQVLPAPKTFDAPACLLTWELPVQPNTAYFLDVSLAGPGHQPMMDEEGWRETLQRFSYTDLEEQLAWQTDFRGEYTVFSSALPRLDRALDASVHFLRTLGEANRDVQWLTDRPYGFPPTDAAAPAEITGVFYEWGLAAFADGYLHDLVDSATAAGQQLSPDRRVALVSGLVSAVRLTHNDEQLVQDTANVIKSLVVQGGAVEPWLDPDVVRADMAALLVRADPAGGPAAAERLPALHWAADDEGPVAAHMLAARKALSAGDREGFWSHYAQLLEGTSRNGLGSMTPGGDLDGRFEIGLMYLSRAMLIDDHGRDLRLLVGSHIELLPERDEFDLPWLPTIFGLADIETYHVPGHRMATTVRLRQQVEPHLIYVYLPAPIRAEKVVDCVGGKARLMPDGSLSAAIDPFLAAGLNFTVTAREGPAER